MGAPLGPARPDGVSQPSWNGGGSGSLGSYAGAGRRGGGRTSGGGRQAREAAQQGQQTTTATTSPQPHLIHKPLIPPVPLLKPEGLRAVGPHQLGAPAGVRVQPSGGAVQQQAQRGLGSGGQQAVSGSGITRQV